MQKGLLYFILTLILFSIGCDSTPENSGEPQPAGTWFPTRVNDKAIEIQLALSISEKQRGLMYREELGVDSGMLFPYDRPQPVGFWMKNTPLPLDLGLFDGTGVLKEIHRLMPYDTTSIRSHSDQIQFALEMHQGWFAKNNLYPGSKLDLDSVSDAIRKRGYLPEQFGIPEK